MSTPADWLERLAKATDYRELQEAFADLRAAVHGDANREAWVAALDEAVERIRRERTRDEDELRAQESEYDSFKEQKSGVFGWLKRHVPFTETRKQDQEHQAQVRDQQAEVQGDSFVIARVLMLRESLLEPARRQLGADRGDWERRLSAVDSASEVRAYAEGLSALQRELPAAKAFLTEIRGAVEAFARAKFRDDADRQRQQKDLEAAKRELEVLQQELRGKEELRAARGERLRALITEELAQGDSSFRALVRRIQSTEAALEAAGQAVEALQGAETGATDASSAVEALETLEAKRGARQEAERLSRERQQVAERKQAQAQAVAGDYAAKEKSAREAAARAQAALAAAQVAAGASPQGAADVTQAERTLEAAQANHRVAAATHESAQAEARVAEAEVREAARQLESLQTEVERLTREESELRTKLDEANRHLELLLVESAKRVETFRAAMDEAGKRPAASWDRTAPRRSLGFPEESSDLARLSAADLQAGADRLRRLREDVLADRTAVEGALAEERRRRESAWSRRAQELLGDALASEVL